MRNPCYLVPLVFCLLFASVAHAEETKDAAPVAAAKVSEKKTTKDDSITEPGFTVEVVDPEVQKQQSVAESMEATRLSLAAKVKEQAELQRKLKGSDPATQPEIQAELNKVNENIKLLRQSFEQLAIGGISLEVFGEKEEEFDWRKELVLVTQPILESLKDLTDKPRKLDRLRTIISDRNQQAEKIDKAIESIKAKIDADPKPSAALLKSLKELLVTWETNQKENQRQIELAQFQLESLLGNNASWWETTKGATESFFSGRGLTLLYVIGASVFVWLFMKALRWVLLYSKRAADDDKHKKQTRYRVAFYLYKVLTTILMTIAIMIVLYVRGDLLLLALVIVIFIGFAMAMRQLLPKYITEARLLLNLGTIREDERVIYNNIPWQIIHINVHSVLRNPELQGVLRVPLSEMTTLNSRPLSSNEPWFPCKKGDFLLMPDGAVAEVLLQTPENVELQSRGGMRITYPSSSFFGMEFYNLTMGGSFGVGSTFGIDYSHIRISLTEVPGVFKKAVAEGLRSAGLNEHVMDVLVDFKTANSSSLDFLIFVTMNSRAASSYFKIERVIQQSCVNACNEKNWDIPFPQLTIHKAD